MSLKRTGVKTLNWEAVCKETRKHELGKQFFSEQSLPTVNNCPVCSVTMNTVFKFRVVVNSTRPTQTQVSIHQSSINQSINQSINHSVIPSVRQSFSPSVRQSAIPSVLQSFSPSVRQSVSLSVHLSVSRFRLAKQSYGKRLSYPSRSSSPAAGYQGILSI